MRCALPPGGGSKSARSLLPDRRPSHSQIFFAGAGIFGNSNAIKEIKSRVISGPGDGRGRPKSRFIFTPPGGGQISGRFGFRTGGPATHTISRVCRNFFSRGRAFGA